MPMCKTCHGSGIAFNVIFDHGVEYKVVRTTKEDYIKCFRVVIKDTPPPKEIEVLCDECQGSGNQQNGTFTPRS